ncbi:hypothetical protein [Hazenella coriacea]|uniref:Group-specific protein n=1 Tax=Hazenella coriacea TaxID=1179467 RepID=A0A4R3L3I2_9BACL|nr:hypothetical protein [Hazenella coriacea]TCS93475.1 hypothetical protein EDD58_107123 [Hazenella coriacea]
MINPPFFPETVITAVRLHGVWRWYITPKEMWILDQVSWSKTFLTQYQCSDEIVDLYDFADRFYIGVLNEETVEHFFAQMEEEPISSRTLHEMLQQSLMDEEVQDLRHYLPTFYVDFDEKLFLSKYPETEIYEKFVPDGWIGKQEDFLHLVPETERYWIIDGVDRFQSLKGMNQNV